MANQNPKTKDDLARFLHTGGFGPVETEYKFHPTRKWRADWYLVDHNIIVEYEGFMTKGANASHASIGGILRDVEKYNAATEMGIRVFRAHAKNVADGTIFALLDRVTKQTWG